MAPHRCKICQGTTQGKYTNDGVTYYYCPTCNFLQNYYWETRPQDPAAEKTSLNREIRERRWPEGERALMHEHGWEMLEFMGWPIAWISRKAHAALKHIPGYRPFIKWWLKRKYKKILDFGCGHGMTVLELRKNDHIHAIGLDPYSPTENEYILRKELKEANFPDNTFDGIFTIETMEHMPNVLETVTELKRILKPGAPLIIQTRRLEDPEYIEQQGNWFYLREPKAHVSIYSEKAFRAIAEKTGWSAIHIRGTRLARLIK